jgi:hypothetical protein
LDYAGCDVAKYSFATVLFLSQHLVGRGEKSVIDLLAQQHRKIDEFILVLDYEPIKQTLKEVERLLD